MIKIDARGLACPGPVLQTKTVVEREDVDALHVVVDNEAAQENVKRFLASKGFETALKKEKEAFYVMATRTNDPITLSAAPASETAAKPAPDIRKIMVMCATDRMGFGDDGLGQKLMVNFIKTLEEMGPELWRLVFVNNGVKLAIQGAETLPVLQRYEQSGLKILVCGTCLTHFDLLDQKQVGETTNMLDIVTAIQLADKVINL